MTPASGCAPMLMLSAASFPLIQGAFVASDHQIRGNSVEVQPERLEHVTSQAGQAWMCNEGGCTRSFDREMGVTISSERRYPFSLLVSNA